MYFERECLDKHEVGVQLTKYVSNAFAEAPKAIEKSGLDCFDVNFNELTKDPIQTVRNLYKAFGWEFTKEYESILVNHLKKDEIKRKAQFEKAKHSQLVIHDPLSFGLDQNKICEQFSPYMEKYGITGVK